MDLEYVDSGTAWNDGDLSYSVIVRKNTFIQTGGDAGEVTGIFFGSNHEGIGGVVESRDMSAGFGARDRKRWKGKNAGVGTAKYQADSNFFPFQYLSLEFIASSWQFLKNHCHLY